MSSTRWLLFQVTDAGAGRCGDHPPRQLGSKTPLLELIIHAAGSPFRGQPPLFAHCSSVAAHVRCVGKYVRTTRQVCLLYGQRPNIVFPMR